MIAGLCVLFARFSLEAYVLDHFKNDGQEEPSEYLKEMKLCHLITMPMGFESPMLMGVIRPQMMEIYCGMAEHMDLKKLKYMIVIAQEKKRRRWPWIDLHLLEKENFLLLKNNMRLG